MRFTLHPRSYLCDRPMTFGEELRVMFVIKPLHVAYRLGFLGVTPGEELTGSRWRWPICTRLTADHQTARAVSALEFRVTSEASAHAQGWADCLDHLTATIARNSAERSAAEERTDDETS